MEIRTIFDRFGGPFRAMAMLTLLVILLPACTLLDERRWAAYDVEIEVTDLDGKPQSGAVVKTTNNQEVTTDPSGRASLYYMNGGLHVITVSAKGRETSQMKISLPMQSEATIRISLAPLLSPLPLDEDSNRFVDTR
ncbi:MAG: carboxypeptidase-like regulatory domain-containing protein [Gammaproteobacteria bacterium]|nr:carboxypeptidase-like regulatory domain-containing protein [Gammaproteobacteria bacterium]